MALPWGWNGSPADGYYDWYLSHPMCGDRDCFNSYNCSSIEKAEREETKHIPEAYEKEIILEKIRNLYVFPEREKN
jgi:hypothetical protein